MSKIRVGVLRGGPSDEYAISLKTGAQVLGGLSKDKYSSCDIFVDKSGGWYADGMPKSVDEISGMVDVVWNALRGEFGEDGKVQQIFESHKIRYTGSQIFASAVSMNKALAKDMVKKSGIKVPFHQLLTRDEFENTDAGNLFRSVMMPVIIKLPDNGSAIGASYAETPEELWEGIKDALRWSDTIMLEQHVRGKEATVGVVDNFRGEDFYSLLPVEIEREDPDDLWGYEERYGGTTVERCPGRFSADEKRELERLAVAAHRAIGARHYSRSDFIVSPRGIYFLEINTLPALTSESSVPKALSASGISFPQFLDHVISLALSP